MNEVRDKAEQSVLQTVARMRRINSASLRVSPQSSDALDRLLERGELRWVGDAVEIAPAVVRLTYKSEEDRPQAQIVPSRPPKSYKEGRRQHYSPLVGPSPARIQQLAGRIMHRIRICGDQDAEGRPTSNKRLLERALHANRLPEWKSAMDILVARKSVEIVGQQVSIVDAVCSQRLPDPFDPVGTKQAKEEKQAKRRSRRKRPLSAWVLRKIAEREGEIRTEGF